jgi:hypothetical protein
MGKAVVSCRCCMAVKLHPTASDRGARDVLCYLADWCWDDNYEVKRNKDRGLGIALNISISYDLQHLWNLSNLPSFAMLTSTARQPTQAAEWLGPHWWQQRELAHPIKNLRHLSFHPLPTSGAIVSSNSPSPANLLCDYRTCTPHTQPIDSRLAAK